MKHYLLSAVFFCVIFLEASAALSVNSLRVNRMDNPAGVDPCGPVAFSWILSSDKNNTYQTAYEVEVKSKASTVWKSGKVPSDNSLSVPYSGGMISGARYDWTVRVWDNNGRVSARARGYWIAGMDAKDWTAEWLCAKADGRAIYFRRCANVGKKVVRATAFISAKGIYQAKINNVPVGEDVLTPGWTSYNKRIQYQVYDVTKLFVRGANEICAEVSSGWYAGGLNWGDARKRYRYGKELAFLMQLRLEYADGTAETISSDKSWEQSYGPVQFANIYDGQTTDFNRSFEWSAVSKVSAIDPALLVAPVSEPVRRRDPIKPVKLIKTPAGETVIDFGQNLTGWERVKISGAKGDTVRITHAEILDNKGNFYTENLRTARATSTIVLSGKEELFEPLHTFYGFRYIRIEGLKGEIDLTKYEAVPICSAFDDCGSFECSDTLINQLQHNINWGFHDNFVDVPTDCPQRDERLGWTGDAQAFFRTATFNGRVENFFRKWLADLSLDQRSDGGVPRVIPDTYPRSKSRIGATGWADCATIIPWQHYMTYGDVSLLSAQYPSMKAWADFCIREAEPQGWLRNTGLDRHYGDWLFYHKVKDNDGLSAVTSKALIAQAFFAESVRIVAESARLVGKEDDAKYYADVYNKVVKAFQTEYITPSGMMVSDTQTAYVLALNFNLMPEHLRSSAVKRLVENIHRYNDHITTGFLGTPYICQVLTDNGRSDVAYTLLMQDTCPSWIYPAKHGATTIWERWDSITPDGTIVGGMNSFNHYSFGAIGDWMYRSALGISETTPGYRTIDINPHAGGGISSMKGGKETPYGRVDVSWKADSKAVITSLDVTIPVGTTASVHFGGKTFEVGSGQYHYE